MAILKRYLFLFCRCFYGGVGFLPEKKTPICVCVYGLDQERAVVAALCLSLYTRLLPPSDTRYTQLAKKKIAAEKKEQKRKFEFFPLIGRRRQEEGVLCDKQQQQQHRVLREGGSPT